MPCSLVFFNVPQQHKVTIMANNPICTHLSNHISLSQFSFGKAEPGSMSNTVQMTNQLMAGRKDGLIFFNDSFLQY
jgi:hypothetical protein